MIEIWRDIKDYEGLYQVSNFGRVRNTKTIKVLKPNKNRCGYLIVGLYKYGKRKPTYIHRLVAEAFIPNPLNLPQVNHKSENKQDNRVENLEYCTAKYNSNYGTRNERMSKKKINGKKAKAVLQYSLDGTFINEFPSAAECGRNGFNQGAVSACCLGKLKYYKGYLWKHK